MSDDLSPVLSLPLLQPSQAQKHVTHNEALRLLDILVQPAVASRTATSPPADPAPGERHIVSPAAGGAWSGQAGAIAFAEAGSWVFLPPQVGWQAHVADESQVAVFDGTAWLTPAEQSQRLGSLGVSTDADATNRLAVASPATLLTHAGAGHQLKINKAAAGDTASLLFQTGWSGRAEMGTTGSDDFAIKVSPDGTGWHTGLRIERGTGRISAPNGLTVTGTVAGTAVTQSATDSTAHRLLKSGDWGLGAAVALADLDEALRPGFYQAPSGAANQPASGSSWATLTLGGLNPSNAVQIAAAISATSRRLYLRTRDAGAWSTGWTQIYHQRSILGAVTQSGGVPTGAVIERGSNANGDYIRFADGTQICWRSITASIALDVAMPTGGFRSNDVSTAIMPAVFSAAPVALSSPLSGCNGSLISGTSLNTVDVRFWGVTSHATAARAANIIAIGRWF